MRHSWKRTAVLVGLAVAYMLVVTFFGSPLLALTTWLGWVEP